jgi:hypothetical protein
VELHQRFPHHQQALLLLLEQARIKKWFMKSESRTRQELAKRKREMFLTKYCYSTDNTLLLTVGKSSFMHPMRKKEAFELNATEVLCQSHFGTSNVLAEPGGTD